MRYRVAVLAVLASIVAPSAAAAQAPAPDEPLPSDPAALAARLADVSEATDTSTEAWLASGGATAALPPDDVVRGALYQQRAARHLARRPKLAARVLRALPARLRPGLRDPVAALRSLFRLSGAAPPRRRQFKVGPALPPAQLRAYYAEGELRFGIPWYVLAAVNLVETDFNRVRSDSVAGARGPMQFLPSTWRAYGLGGDIKDPHDAIVGAANYLRANGGRRDLRRALFGYNHSGLYVDAVLRFADRIRRGPRAYVTLWSWQVFQRTPDGERRLTGPDLP